MCSPSDEVLGNEIISERFQKSDTGLPSINPAHIKDVFVRKNIMNAIIKNAVFMTMKVTDAARNAEQRDENIGDVERKLQYGTNALTCAESPVKSSVGSNDKSKEQRKFELVLRRLITDVKPSQLIAFKQSSDNLLEQMENVSSRLDRLERSMCRGTEVGIEGASPDIKADVRIRINLGKSFRIPKEYLSDW